MTTQTAYPELPAALYRSEAFAEDLDDDAADAGQSVQRRQRRIRAALVLALPLALLLLGSASALACA